MNPPRVHMCPPSQSPLPLPSPLCPSGSSQCTGPEHTASCIEPGLVICFTYDNTYLSLLNAPFRSGDLTVRCNKLPPSVVFSSKSSVSGFFINRKIFIYHSFFFPRSHRRSGTESRPPALGVQCLGYWATRKVPVSGLLSQPDMFPHLRCNDHGPRGPSLGGLPACSSLFLS